MEEELQIGKLEEAMERLTYEKSPKGWDRGKYPTKYTSRHTFQEVVARLAAYEDTGLEPEEVKEHEAAYIEIMTRAYGPLHQKIGRWLQAEKDGRLVVLPCKVGDAVYFPVEGRWDAATIDRIEIDSNGVRLGWVQYDVGPEVNELWADGCFTAGDIGKTVFLTREEAEAALKKREGD